ncbi:MAG: hypothetical protein EPO39_10170 [Candidatus Manganitrophaceae bacterium]|nr:MAG: hypothetical protein EPO39_10170 [Candidatus Manganitrophaceae bacterium]
MTMIALFIYIIGTYFPLIYTYVPLLGALKVVLVAGIVLVFGFIGTYGQYRNPTAYKNSIVYCWVIFLAFMMFGIFVSLDKGMTLDAFLANLKVFFIFLVMIKIVDSLEKLERVLAVFTLCGVGMGISAIYNYVFGTETLTGGHKLSDTYRAIALRGGLFGDPNDLALLFNSVLPFAIYFLLVKEKKTIHLLGVVILVLGTMLSYSRAGFLGLCVTGLMFLFFFKVRMKYFVYLLAFAILFWSFAPESYKERIRSITAWEVDEETGKTGTRMDAWKDGLVAGLEHPILGVGAGASVYVNGTRLQDWHQTHNAFVQVFIEIGTIGFAIYLSLFVLPYKQYKRYSRNIDKRKMHQLDILYKMIIISLVAFASTAFFTPNAYSPLLFMLTALAVIGSEAMKKESNALKVSAARVLVPQATG